MLQMRDGLPADRRRCCAPPAARCAAADAAKYSMRSRVSRRMRAPFLPARSLARAWKRAPTRFCDSPTPPRSAPRSRRPRSRTSTPPDVEFARLQVLDWKFESRRARDTRAASNRRRPRHRPQSGAQARWQVAPSSPGANSTRIFVEPKRGARRPAALRAGAAKRVRANPTRPSAPTPRMPNGGSLEFTHRPAMLDRSPRLPSAAPAATLRRAASKCRRSNVGAANAPADRDFSRLPSRMSGTTFRSTCGGTCWPASRQLRSGAARVRTAGDAVRVARRRACRSALLLVAQIIHQNRAWLAAHAPLRGSLRALYSAWHPGAPPANLSAYQLRQWGVTGDPDARRHAARARQHPQHRRAIPALSAAARDARQSVRRAASARATSSPPNTWASRRRSCWRPASAPMRRWTSGPGKERGRVRDRRVPARRRTERSRAPNDAMRRAQPDAHERQDRTLYVCPPTSCSRRWRE